MSRVRVACRKVMEKSRHVKIDNEAITESLIQYNIEPEPWEAFEFHYTGAKIIDYIFALDSLNFCFWPHLNYDYPDLARNLKMILQNDPLGLSPQTLSVFSIDNLFQIFPPDFPDLEVRLNKVHELGRVTIEKFEGSYQNILQRCNNSALKLIDLIIENFEGFQDIFQYGEDTVFLLKRVQILVSDLHGSGSWQFNDMNELTMFPDYQVPQVLNTKGILKYSEELQRKVDNKEEIPKGSEMEIEIRAATVVACDIIANSLNQPAYKVDWLLWQVGENEKKAGLLKPHHRTITTFY